MTDDDGCNPSALSVPRCTQIREALLDTQLTWRPKSHTLPGRCFRTGPFRATGKHPGRPGTVRIQASQYCWKSDALMTPCSTNLDTEVGSANLHGQRHWSNEWDGAVFSACNPQTIHLERAHAGGLLLKRMLKSQRFPTVCCTAAVLPSDCPHTSPASLCPGTSADGDGRRESASRSRRPRIGGTRHDSA